MPTEKFELWTIRLDPGPPTTVSTTPVAADDVAIPVKVLPFTKMFTFLSAAAPASVNTAPLVPAVEMLLKREDMMVT
jgi:hypothetical protein